MIFYYVLVLSLPLVSHPVFGSEAAGFTVVKYLGLVCLAYALLRLLARRRRPAFSATYQARAFLLFFAFTALSYVASRFGPNPGNTDVLIAYLSHVVFFFITLLVVDSVERLRRVLLVAIASMALASLYVLREWQGGSAVYGSAYRPGYVTGDPNFYAASALLCIPLAFGWMLERRPGWERLFCVGSLLVGLAGSMVAASRGGFIGLLAGMTFFVWRSRRRTKSLVVCGGALLLFLALSPSSPWRRLVNPHRGDEQATDVRLQLWTSALKMVRDHPLFGVGLGNFKATVGGYGDLPDNLQLAAHNAYLEVAAEVGAPGLLALLAMILLSYRSLDRVRRQTRRTGPPFLHQASLGIQAGLVGFAVALVFVSGLFLKLFWLMVFLSMCLPRLVARERVEPRQQAA